MGTNGYRQAPLLDPFGPELSPAVWSLTKGPRPKETFPLTEALDLSVNDRPAPASIEASRPNAKKAERSLEARFESMDKVPEARRSCQSQSMGRCSTSERETRSAWRVVGLVGSGSGGGWMAAADSGSGGSGTSWPGSGMWVSVSGSWGCAAVATGEWCAAGIPGLGLKGRPEKVESPKRGLWKGTSVSVNVGAPLAMERCSHAICEGCCFLFSRSPEAIRSSRMRWAGRYSREHGSLFRPQYGTPRKSDVFSYRCGHPRSLFDRSLIVA